MGKVLRTILMILDAALLGPPREILKSIKGIGRFLKAAPGRLFSVPARLYRRIIRVRNKLLAVVEYLQAESNKWRTVFNVVKSPYTTLRWMGLSPNFAMSLLLAGSVTGTAVVAEQTVFADRSFSNGDSGVYSAPQNQPIMWSEEMNTLRLDLGTIPVKEISITDVSVGTVYGAALPSGATTTIEVGTAGVILEVGHLVFENNRCKALLLSHVKTHTLNISGNASDGQSIAPSAGFSRMRAVGGGHHMASAMKTPGGTYDRIQIHPVVATASVDKLVLNNVFTKGGGCTLKHIRAGTNDIVKNTIGQGDGLATKDFTVMTDVTAQVMNISDNVEVEISEPATVNPN